MGVVVGGALAVGGSAATQWYLHAAKSADDRRRLRDHKLEELIALVYEHAHWMDRLRAINVLGKDERQTISPLSKLIAVAPIDFPEFMPSIRRLEHTAGGYTEMDDYDGATEVGGKYRRSGRGLRRSLWALLVCKQRTFRRDTNVCSTRLSISASCEAARNSRRSRHTTLCSYPSTGLGSAGPIGAIAPLRNDPFEAYFLARR